MSRKSVRSTNIRRRRKHQHPQKKTWAQIQKRLSRAPDEARQIVERIFRKPNPMYRKALAQLQATRPFLQ